MRKVSVSEAQNELQRPILAAEPLIVMHGEEPIAVLVPVRPSAIDSVEGGRRVTVLRLKDVLTSNEFQAMFGDDAVCVVSSTDTSQRPTSSGDWWEALKRIDDAQRKRGFVGAVVEIDRADEGYEERMNEIFSQTARTPAG